jgi:hypothetical protein
MQAEIIDPDSERISTFLNWLEHRLERLARDGAPAEELAIVDARLPAWRRSGDGAMRQRRLYAESASPAAMIAHMREDGWMAWGNA